MTAPGRWLPLQGSRRLPSWSEAVEREYPGTYNARRDKLGEAWHQLFGYNHGLMVVERFYEHVDRDGQDVVLEFVPQDHEPMLVACLWNRSPGYGGAPDLLSFAAITDEPPPEVAAAGHDRCITQIRPEQVDAWLNPDPANLAAMQAILEDRPWPHYGAPPGGLIAASVNARIARTVCAVAWALRAPKPSAYALTQSSAKKG